MAAWPQSPRWAAASTRSGFCRPRPPTCQPDCSILELRLTIDTLIIVSIDVAAAFFYFVLLSPERQVIDTMSRASKVTLAATTLAAAGIIYFVHWAQEADRAVGQVSP